MFQSSKKAKKRLKKQVQAALVSTTHKNRTLRIIEASNIAQEVHEVENSIDRGMRNKNHSKAEMRNKSNGKEKDLVGGDKRAKKIASLSSSESEFDDDIDDLFPERTKQIAFGKEESINHSKINNKPEKSKINRDVELCESSSGSSKSHEEAEFSEVKEKKKVRGPTRLDILPVSEQRRKNVRWNRLGQPIGKSSITLSSTLGVIARQYLPITINNWKKVDKELKERLWSLILVRFILYV